MPNLMVLDVIRVSKRMTPEASLQKASAVSGRGSGFLEAELQAESEDCFCKNSWLGKV